MTKSNQRTVKIAQVCPRYHPSIGGIETHVKEISERLAARGFQIEVLTTDSRSSVSQCEVLNGLTVKRFPSWAPGESYYFSQPLWLHLSRHSSDFDIIHAHSLHALPALYAARTRSSNRFVLTTHYHGRGHSLGRNLAQFLWRPLAKSMVNGTDKVICVSNYEKGLVQRRFGTNPNSITVIPNGINTPEFSNLHRSGRMVKTLSYVGRLEEYKGVQHVIKCLKFLDPEYRLTIVGEGPYYSSLRALAKHERVEGQVRFIPRLERSALIDLYATSSVYVYLSKLEAFGLTVAEALAAGTPCVVRRGSALEEWVDNVHCFGIVDPNDVAALADLIGRASESRREPIRLPNWNEVVDRLVDVYETTLAGQQMPEKIR